MSAFSAAAQDEDGDIISALRARVADLEAQLYAVGAGGVGKPEQPQSVTNCHQSQPQGEQEPVAYYVMNGAALFQLFRSKSQADALAYDLQKRHDLSGSLAHFHVVPLYTHPQPRKPLTDDERQDVYAKAIKAISNDLSLSWRDAIVFGTERAHRIGGEA